SQIGAEPTASLELIGFERPFALRIHDREICVGAYGDRSLAGIESEGLRRRGGGQVRDAFERQATSMHAVRDEDGQGRLNPGHAAPRLPDIVSALLLVRGGAGRVI